MDEGFVFGVGGIPSTQNPAWGLGLKSGLGFQSRSLCL